MQDKPKVMESHCESVLFENAIETPGFECSGSLWKPAASDQTLGPQLAGNKPRCVTCIILSVFCLF